MSTAVDVRLFNGQRVTLRQAVPDDEPALEALLARLARGPEPRLLFPACAAGEAFAETLCRRGEARDAFTLLALDDDEHVVAAGSWVRTADDAADLALAVDPELRGVGLGGFLLAHLATRAAWEGLARLTAATHPENVGMLRALEATGLSAPARRDEDVVRIDLGLVPERGETPLAGLAGRIATIASMRPLLKPASIAVVGASSDAQSLGYRVLDELVRRRFAGPVYAVNPKRRNVGPLPASPSLRELPEAVDLAVILVPAEHVEGVVDDAVARGVRSLVVISAGFAETGPEGRARQERILAKVREHGLRMVGPNCMGIVNAADDVRMNATFSSWFPEAGSVGMLSQSGALGVAILAFASSLGLGLSTFVSVGNKADVSGNDLLEWWEADPATQVVLLYLESFGNPRRFARIARRVSRTKPVIVVKSGRSDAGRRAAGSHTAALAEADVAADALFAQTGVLRADTLEEMFDLALVLASQPLPVGRRVAVLTNAGGPGILAADALAAHGLDVPELSPATRDALAAFLPPAASTRNPVDMIASASPEQFERASAILLADPEVDALLVIDVPIDRRGWDLVEPRLLAGVDAGLSRGGHAKPVVACVMGTGHEGRAHLLADRLPAFTFPEAAARALAGASRYATWRAMPPSPPAVLRGLDLDAAVARARAARAREVGGWLRPDDAFAVLADLGLSVLPHRLVTTAEEAVAAARAIGGAIALKIVSADVLHKSDRGGVVLGLEGDTAVRRAFEAMASSFPRREGVFVQAMAPPDGTEVLLGVALDPSFGPLVAFGLGGVHVEVLRDVVFRIAPLEAADAAAMVAGLRGHALLEGHRGTAPRDRDAIEDALLRISRLAEALPELAELDINPAFTLPVGHGLALADVRMRLATPAAPPTP
ncbi:MAG: GNAT family N-acetyltransferase [Planctomycetota bacterium]